MRKRSPWLRPPRNWTRTKNGWSSIKVAWRPRKRRKWNVRPLPSSACLWPQYPTSSLPLLLPLFSPQLLPFPRRPPLPRSTWTMAKGRSRCRISANPYHRSTLETWTHGSMRLPPDQVSRCAVCTTRKRSNMLNWRTLILPNNPCWCQVLVGSWIFSFPFLSSLLSPLDDRLSLPPMTYVLRCSGTTPSANRNAVPLSLLSVCAIYHRVR